jgi:hypothetical protein
VVTPAATTYNFGDKIRVTTNGEGLLIEGTKEDFSILSYAELNKLAYIINVTQEYLLTQGNTQMQTVTIENSGK